MKDFGVCYFRCLLLILVLISAGCSSLPKAIAPVAGKQSCDGEHEIFIISHGWHAGVAIKARELDRVVPGLSARFPGSVYYEIGWGDSRFYQSDAITFASAMLAVLWSSGSVLHVVGLKDDPRLIFRGSEVRLLASDSKNFENLLLFINSSFRRDSNDAIVPENHGLYGDGQFYAAVGKFHLLNTCNTWTAKALYSAGYDVSPVFSVTSSGIMNSLDNVCPDGD